jgi:hypothetical protein
MNKNAEWDIKRYQDFKYHFSILDSVSIRAVNDTVYKCSASVEFMEENTGIEAGIDGDYIGPLGFLKNDLRKWHEWFDKKYKRVVEQPGK